MRRSILALLVGLSALAVAACGEGGTTPTSTFDDFASPSDVVLPSDMLESPSDLLESPASS